MEEIQGVGVIKGGAGILVRRWPPPLWLDPVVLVAPRLSGVLGGLYYYGVVVFGGRVDEGLDKEGLTVGVYATMPLLMFGNFVPACLALWDE